MNKQPFKVSLSVDSLEVSDEVLDNHLAILEVYVCHDGNNAHNLPIKLETIKDAQDTLKNKPLVAGFDGRDFEGHEVDEVIIGYFPESSNMKYVKKNNKTYLVAEAIMPKLYAKWAYDIFQKNSTKSVSMEIEVEDYEELGADLIEIKKFIFNAVTVLGESHMPACEGANATMVKFSKESVEKVYEKHLTSQNIKNKYFDVDIPIESDETTYMEKNIKINNNKEAAITSGSWDNPDKSLYEPLLNSDNSKSLVNEAYLIVEPGYEDAPSEHLKYPHHSLKGSELVLNERGVIAAFQRASQEGIVSGKVKEHLLRHYRELGLSTENFEINEKGGKSMPEEEKMEEKVEKEVEEIKDEETFDSQKEDEKSDRDDAKEEAKKEENDERSEIDDYREEEKGEEMEADSEAECQEDFNDDKKKIAELEAEICALKEKLCKYEEEDKTRMVEAALSNVVELMSADEISALREDAKNYSLEEMTAFENKVKAIAFEKITEAKKDEEKPSYTKMAITATDEKKVNGLW